MNAILKVIFGMVFLISFNGMAEPLKWRHSQHVTKAEAVEVGDLTGHSLTAAKGSGLGFFENGEVATLAITAIVDYVNGSGPFSGYVIYNFEDGASFTIKIAGTTTTAAGGKSSALKGEFTFTQGAGRFAGIKGGGAVSAKRLSSALSGGSEVYMDFSGDYSR